MLESLLRENRDELVKAVSDATGTGIDEADGFVRTAIAMLQREIASGRLELGSVLRGDFESIKGAMNFSELGEAVHAGSDTAERGVVAMLEPMRTSLGTVGDGLGSIDGLLKQIVGGRENKDGAQDGGGLLGIVGDVLGGGEAQ